MNLSSEKLKIYWKNRETIFNDPKNKAICERFETLKTLFEQISKFTFIEKEEEKQVCLKYNEQNNEQEYKIVLNKGNGQKETSPDLLDYWVSAMQGLCKDNNENGSAAGIKDMAKKFSLEADNGKKINLRQLIWDIGCMLGGYVFTKLPDKSTDYFTNMLPEYRLRSCRMNDDGGALTVGINKYASSHFADNNVFYRVIQTYQAIQNNNFDVYKSNIVLRYPSCGVGNDLEKQQQLGIEKQQQQKILNHLFFYKFLYSWAHMNDDDRTIPLFSLMEYQNLCRQDCEETMYNDSQIGQEYGDFAGTNSNKPNTGWKDYSNKIVKELTKDDNNEIKLLELGKLLAIVTLQDSDIKNIRDLVETGNKAIILWGPPGTGKTYQAMELVKEMLEIKDDEKDNEIEKYRFTKKTEKQEKEKKNEDEEKNPQNCNSKENDDAQKNATDQGTNSAMPKPVDNGMYALVQFHPNYTYEDFVGGISPKLEGGNLSYELRTGIFKAFCDEAAKKGNERKKFIFIIDEINRADLSAVFGELLYALEYRGKAVNIPHFGDFVIPPNVYLIGTMNNVDKSLTTFDLALRRRFGFFKMMPKLNVIADILENDQYIVNGDKLQDFIKRCEDLNNAIKDNNNNGLGLGEDYQIGHAYFGKIKDFLKKPDDSASTEGAKKEIEITSLELEKLWVYHLLPLIEEYLGGRMEDDNIKGIVNNLCKKFIQGL